MSHPLSTEFLTSAIITLTICAFGLLGNALCAVVLFSKHMNRTSYTFIMQGLTISDICLLTLSFIRTLDNLGVIRLSTEVYATTVVFFWDWISTSATKYYTVAISIERLFVITFPLKAHTWLTTETSKATAIGIFGFCVLLSCFSFAYVNWIAPKSFDIYVAIVLHFLPFILVVVFNTLILFGLRKLRQNSIRKTSTTSMREDEYRITKMLFTIVLVFGICYSFEFVRRVMNFLWKDYMTTYDYYDYTINNLADIFYVLNSSANFVIYCVLGKQFRDVFCKVFKLPFSERRESEGGGGGVKLGKNSNNSDSGNGSFSEDLGGNSEE